jgi:dTDP-4-amino-4,6-dideoxygalactose transaminase
VTSSPRQRSVEPSEPPQDPDDRSVRAGKPFLVFGQPQIGDAEIDEVVATMRGAWLGTGPKVAAFEEAFRTYKSAPHAVAVSSCTAAMHLSLIAAGIGAGDEVIVPALTFCATVNVVIHVGATPVLADVDSATMNIDPTDIANRVTSRTKAVMPVHFGGRPCDMDAIDAIAGRHGLTVIEDCAHAIETTYKGRPAGSFGSFGCFSFYATKNVTTGEGGMVLTKRAEDADSIKIQALHGMSRDAWKRYSDSGFKHYQVVAAGFKYNMMDLQAAIGLHQLERVEANWQRRGAIWNRYLRELSGLPLTLPAPLEPSTRHGYHLFTVLLNQAEAGMTRDDLLNAMTGHGIGVGVHYLSIPEHDYYESTFGWRAEMYPRASQIGRTTVSLPLSARLSDEDVSDVIEALRRVLGSA